MGHNDLDFAQHPAREHSRSFGNESQNRLILDGLLWLGNASK
jgi:hypothetical protein